MFHELAFMDCQRTANGCRSRSTWEALRRQRFEGLDVPRPELGADLVPEEGGERS